MKSSNRSISLGELTALVHGKLVGDASYTISGISPLDDPSPVQITFLRERTVKKLVEALEGRNFGAVLILDTFAVDELPPNHNLILVKDPLHALMALVPTFYVSETTQPGISPLASVAPSATIAADACIGPFCVIGERVVIKSGANLHPHVVLYNDVEIGTGSTLYARVIVREGCKIGPDSIIHCGVVIGADGFGFTPIKDDKGKTTLTKVPQVGIVEIGAKCEIGANTCIDRATFGRTKIGISTKIDNLVQIGHNAQIGNGTLICGQAAIAGSCKIGNGVVLGGNSGVSDHMTIVDGCRVSAKAGVIKDLLEPGDYAGFPAIKSSQWIRQLREVAKLTEKKTLKDSAPREELALSSLI